MSGYFSSHIYQIFPLLEVKLWEVTHMNTTGPLKVKAMSLLPSSKY